MSLRRQLITAAMLLCALAAPLSAAPPGAVYVTTGSGKQVLKIQTSGGAVATLATVNDAGTTAVSDLTLGPDGVLHVATSNGVARINRLTGTASSSLVTNTDVRELRFAADGTLYCNTAAGVKRACVTNLPTGSGTGLAFTANGRLLAVIGNQIQKLQLTSGAPVTEATFPTAAFTAATSLAVATGGEGTAGVFHADDIVVADGGTLRKISRDKTSATGYRDDGTLYSMSGGRTIGYADFDAEDVLWFTTYLVNGSSKSPNGELWKYDGLSAPVRVASAPKVQGVYWPFVGLALDPSSRTRTVDKLHPIADFGTHLYEILGTLADGCSVSVTAKQTLRADVPTLPPGGFSAVTYLGEEALVIVYQAALSPAGCTMFPLNDGKVFIAALESANVDLRLMRCDASCQAVTLTGVYATGPIEDDAVAIGDTDNFSDWLLANQAVAGSGLKFCGTDPPLDVNGSSSLKSGSTVAVKFRLASGTDCAAGPFVTDPNAKFLISLARVSGGFTAIHVPSASGNSNDPPLFRVSGQSWIYDLSLTNPDYDPSTQAPANSSLPPGRYQLTITDTTSPPQLVQPPPIYFTVVP